MMQYKVGYCSQ